MLPGLSGLSCNDGDVLADYSLQRVVVAEVARLREWRPCPRDAGDSCDDAMLSEQFLKQYQQRDAHVGSRADVCHGGGGAAGSWNDLFPRQAVVDCTFAQSLKTAP